MGGGFPYWAHSLIPETHTLARKHRPVYMPAFPHVSSQCHRLHESFPEHPLLSLSHLSTHAGIFFIDLHTYLIPLEIRSHVKPYHLVPSRILSFPICEALTIGMRMKRDKYVPPGGPNRAMPSHGGTNFYKHQGREPQLCDSRTTASCPWAKVSTNKPRERPRQLTLWRLCGQTGMETPSRSSLPRLQPALRGTRVLSVVERVQFH